MILFGADADVARWVAEQIAGVPEFFSPMAAAIGFLKDNQLIAGVVYDNYRETVDKKPLSIDASIASVDKRFCTRHNLRVMFAYPFVQLRLERIQLLTSVNNEGVSDFVKNLGFTLEGLHKRAYFNGDDALSWGMLREECRWINGKEHSVTSRSSGPGKDGRGANAVQQRGGALSGAAQ